MRAIVLGTRSQTRHLENNLNPNNPEPNANASAQTPTRRPARLLSRQPLQSRDQNAMMRVPTPLTVKSGNVNMPPYEKQHGQRPLIPTLSASTKPPNNAPLTPRVAGPAPAGASTPLSRRAARSENSTPAGPIREDLSTPVSTFLNHNITPRSGSRKSRVDSTNTTPTGTPTPAPAPALVASELLKYAREPPALGSGLGIGGSDQDIPKRPLVTFSPATSEVGQSKSPLQPSLGDSKFFFASDAKTGQTSKPLLQSKNSSSFFYANGDSIPSPQSSGTSAVGSNVAEERAQPKFFHANGVPDLHTSSSPHFPPPRPSSTVSSSSRINSPRLAGPGTFSPPQRPASPSKLNQYASTSTLRSVPSLPSPVLPRPQPSGRGQSANSVVTARKTSVEVSQRVPKHGRSASLSSNDSKSTAKRVSSGSSFEARASMASPDPVASSVLVSSPEQIPEEVEPAAQDPPSEPQSPIKAGHSIEHMNELAANARRERKVLDLEITNSSLAAINRTLEREMRKQTAELRRYRRLSRSGRLSIATSASVRTSTGSHAMMDGVEGCELSDMSEEEEESDEESDYDSSEEESAEGSLSPGAMAANDLRHRKKDEKRLQLDLSKHQQLLIDSQKMNQSLKRCLGWTEELIKEGKKALDYNVRVSDVELGGRVLAPDDVEEMENEGMSDIGSSLLEQARIVTANGIAAWVSEGRDDRDSGIVLDGSQREYL
jgi:hypothetical protein